MEKVDYDEIFRCAKKSTVYAHAMVWIKHILENEKKLSDSEKFNEIQEIVLDATYHLEDKDEE